MYRHILTIKTVLSTYALPIAIAGIIVLGAGWYTLTNSGSKKEQVSTIRSGPFLQQVFLSGKVVAASDVDLGFAQGGRVSGVYVRVGNSVGAGQTIAEVENGDLRAAVLERQATLETQEAKLAALQEGPRPEQIAVAQASVDSAKTTLEQSRRALIDAIRQGYTASDDAIHNSFDQFMTNPRSSVAKLNFTTNNPQLAIDIEAARPDMERRLTAWQSAIDTLTPATDLSSGVTEATANLQAVAQLLSKGTAALKAAVPTSAISQTTIDSYASSMATSRASIDIKISALTSAITAERGAITSLTSAQKSLELAKVGALQADIDAQKAQVKAAAANLANAQAQLGKTIIRAPFSGLISKMDLKVGGIATANSSDISLQSSGAFQIESFVPEVSVAELKIDNIGEATLDAYGDEVTFPIKLISIDPAETVRDGVTTYRTKFEFIARDPRIRSGMTANLKVTTAKKDNVLSVPQGIVVDRDGKKYVPVKEGQTIIEREVTTGAVSSRGDIEILSGLQVGDSVVLVRE